MPHLLLSELPRFDCLLEASNHYPDLDPSACEVFLHLLHTGDQVHAHEADYLKSHLIAKGRFAVLLLLERGSRELADCPVPSTPAEIAEALGVTRATMTGLIDNLQKEGLVLRTPDLNDRRVLRVALTEKGKAFVNQILPGYFRHITLAMNQLSEDERKTLVRLLVKIKDAIPSPSGSGVENHELELANL